MHVTMTQYAVGQGGLFSGEMNCGLVPLRWVYDCGSNQRDALSRGIAKVVAGGNIDLLFLSHLDSDHIGGVDQFLSQVRVREVVLPYLNATMLIAIIALDTARGVLSGTFVEAASDLAGWFGSRGVETITFVGGHDDDEGGEGPALPDEPSGSGDGEVGTKWTREPERVHELVGYPNVIQAANGGSAKMQQVAPDTALQLFASGNVLNWALIPYVHMPPAKLMKAFDNALEDYFGAPLDKKQIVNSAKDSDVRDKLRKCYDALWLDHNLISMTLYSGPWKLERVPISRFTIRHHDRWSHEHGGWMLTGDAHLDRQRRRQRFLQFYRRLMPLINVLMLPHHGSIHNHSDLVLDCIPELMIGYAAVGPNSYGHPHRSVCNAVRAHRRASSTGSPTSAPPSS